MAIRNDKYMIYDNVFHRYVLTAEYCSDILGIDIENRIRSTGAPNSTAVINSLLRSASAEIYAYLYKFNNNRDIQWIIANSETARTLIMEAMGSQITYIFNNGDLSYVADKKDNESLICPQSKILLNTTTIPETDCVLTYCGAYLFTSPSYVVGGY